MKKTLLFLVLALLPVFGFAQGEQYYSYKTGSYDLVVSMTGQKMTTHVIFAEYGAYQYSEMEMMGQKVKTLMRDGRSWMIAPGVQEVPMEDNVNYNNLTPEAIQKFGIEMVGLEEVDGYDCLVYTLKMNYQGMEGKGKTWIWEGFPIRAEVTIMGMKLVTTLKNLELDTDVDMSLFEIPEK